MCGAVLPCGGRAADLWGSTESLQRVLRACTQTRAASATKSAPSTAHWLSPTAVASPENGNFRYYLQKSALLFANFSLGDQRRGNVSRPGARGRARLDLLSAPWRCGVPPTGGQCLGANDDRQPGRRTTSYWRRSSSSPPCRCRSSSLLLCRRSSCRRFPCYPFSWAPWLQRGPASPSEAALHNQKRRFTIRSDVSQRMQ